MNADALLHTIRLKVPSGSDLREALGALGAKMSFAQVGRLLDRPGPADREEPVTFHSMVSSAVVEPRRRLNWHRLALLDFALTAGVILAGGVCTWVLIDTIFGFLAW